MYCKSNILRKGSNTLLTNDGILIGFNDFSSSVLSSEDIHLIFTIKRFDNIGIDEYITIDLIDIKTNEMAHSMKIHIPPSLVTMVDVTNLSPISTSAYTIVEDCTIDISFSDTVVTLIINGVTNTYTKQSINLLNFRIVNSTPSTIIQLLSHTEQPISLLTKHENLIQILNNIPLDTTNDEINYINSIQTNINNITQSLNFNIQTTHTPPVVPLLLSVNNNTEYIKDLNDECDLMLNKLDELDTSILDTNLYNMKNDIFALNESLTSALQNQSIDYIETEVNLLSVTLDSISSYSLILNNDKITLDSLISNVGVLVDSTNNSINNIDDINVILQLNNLSNNISAIDYTNIMNRIETSIDILHNTNSILNDINDEIYLTAFEQVSSDIITKFNIELTSHDYLSNYIDNAFNTSYSLINLSLNRF